MKLDETIELLKLLSTIPIDNSTSCPEMRIFHNMSTGYTLCIKSEEVDTEYRKNLNKITEALNYAIREKNEWLIIFKRH